MTEQVCDEYEPDRLNLTQEQFATVELSDFRSDYDQNNNKTFEIDSKIKKSMGHN
jgi:Fe-S-cluster formation regulator IscX/YfhJ